MWIAACRAHNTKSYAALGTFDTEESARASITYNIDLPNYRNYEFALFALTEIAARPVPVVEWRKVKTCA